MHRSPVLLTGVALAVAAVLFPAIGLCQLNVLNIFSDPQGTNCLITDAQPGIIAIYVFHNTNEAIASQFRIATDAGFTGTYISHQVAPTFLDLGTPPVDYSVSYASCAIGSFLVTTVVYFGVGTSAPCSQISIAPAPTSPIPGQVAVVQCVLDVVVGHSNGPAVVNYTGACFGWCIGATEPSSWGRIKALYR